MSEGLDLPDGVVEVVGDRIGYVGPASAWTGGRTEPAGVLVPGLVDIHCHGGGGHSIGDDPAEVAAAADHHLAHGTTTMLASLVSADVPTLLAGISAIGEVAGGDSPVVGVHLEGPWLDCAHRGAHDPALLSDPDPTVADRLVAAGPVRMVTLAPERPGAPETTAVLEAAGVLVGLGHTDADADTFATALAASRAGHVTHLFNGMEPLHHRRPGPVAASLAALARGEATVELIADGVHLADETVALVFSVGAAGVVLVSDAMVAAGMPDGDYRLGTLEVDVVDGRAWTRAEPRSLAGSTAHLADVLRRCVLSAGISAQYAVAAASATPARLLGLVDRGRLEAGLRADLVALDDDWRVSRVMRDGRWAS